MSDLLRPKQVAEILNVESSQVYVLLKNGSLRGVRLSERCTRIYADSIAELLKKRAIRANS